MKEFKYFNSDKIDKSKWDVCIQDSINRRVYACSWYLDSVSKYWGALIYGDYELVFPIIFKKILIFKKIYHPFFCQQLGPFSSDYSLLNNDHLLLYIVNYLDENYRTFHFSINYSCVFTMKNIIENRRLNSNQSNITIDTRINLELDLYHNYATISSYYNQNTKRNLKKSKEYNFEIQELDDVAFFISSYKKHVGYKTNLKSNNYSTIRSLIITCINHKKGRLIGLYDDLNNIVACAFFVLGYERDILLFHFSHQNLTINVMSILLDKYIYMNSSKNKILDFEGSSIPSIKRFYRGFGSVERNYIHIIK